MYAAILFPQAPATSQVVRAFERAVIAAEGRHHVSGQYFAHDDDACRLRRMEAERFEREAARYVSFGELWSLACGATDIASGRAA